MAVSGGPDSLALLLLASAALPGRVEAATVDHGLRQESADEALAVGAICHRLGVAHQTLTVRVAPGNLQAAARSARYSVLADWLEERGLEGLATAHHAEDQAETILMRLNRGSGVAGLGGIRAITNVPGAHNRLVRPLLGWRKAELVQIVSAAGLEPSLDPSNENIAFDRVQVRRTLRDADWLDPVAFARSAQLAAEADFTLDRLSLEELSASSDTTRDYAYFPYRRRPETVGVMPLWLQVVQKMAIQFGRPLDTAEAAVLVTNLRAGRKSNVGGVEGRVERRGGEIAWVLAPEPRRKTG